MKVEIIYHPDDRKEVVELAALPREGEQFETRNCVVVQVLRLVHTPFDPDVAARIVVGYRGPIGVV